VTTFLKDSLDVKETATKQEEMSTVGRMSNLKPSDGVVIVDHGSRRAQSNEMLHLFVDLCKQKMGHTIVEPAHMELADPSISYAFDRCVEQGAQRVIICPYFFFPGPDLNSIDDYHSLSIFNYFFCTTGTSVIAMYD